MSLRRYNCSENLVTLVRISCIGVVFASSAGLTALCSTDKQVSAVC
jgi:hypothetical protein